MFKTIEQVKNKEKGFSLLELSVAVGIAAIVAAVAITATTGFVNGASTAGENYQANASDSVTESKASFDALWGEGEAPNSVGEYTGGNGGNNDSTPPENNEPEITFPIVFTGFQGINPSEVARYWNPENGFSGEQLTNQQRTIIADNLKVGDFISFSNDFGQTYVAFVGEESDYIADTPNYMTGAIELNTAPGMGGAGPQNALWEGFITAITLHGSDNPLG